MIPLAVVFDLYLVSLYMSSSFKITLSLLFLGLLIFVSEEEILEDSSVGPRPLAKDAIFRGLISRSVMTGLSAFS